VAAPAPEPDRPAARTVLITGAARRVGATVARRLAADGWNVVIHYNRSAEDAERLVDEIRASGGTCSALRADFMQRADTESLMARCAALHGSVECLINNASDFRYDDIATLSWDSLAEHLASNLVAPVILCRDFARLDGGAADRCIINLLDQKIANLNPDFLSYTIGKVALSGFTHMLAMALVGRVRVCGIAPGIALISGKQTPEAFERAWRAPPFGRSTTPEEIAACIRFILATPSMTGNTIFLDGGESLRGRHRDVAFDTSV
jgi:NAD(P)-dependent dehydrogenase (short-subunit alcohol dehydrogenase family)